MLLKDRIILITGARGALGQALVAAVRAQGGVPFGTDIVAGDGVDMPHDVTSESSWAEVVAEVDRRHGRLDGLVNNAGLIHVGTVESTTLEDFRRIQAVNVDGVFLGCKVAWPLPTGQRQNPRLPCAKVRSSTIMCTSSAPSTSRACRA
jgi:3(or 17)beta-hydroxysteroid dehydrogenase